MTDSLLSVNLFRCESITLKSHWVLVVMDQFTRRIIGFGVHAGDVDGIALLSNKATSGMGIPNYVSSDHDPLFKYHQWKANLRILEVEEIKSIPYVPLSHPFIEQLIGTIRRELLDHVIFRNACDLERKLEEFGDFYNGHRVYASLGGDTPLEFSEEAVINRTDLHQFLWQMHCRGLFQIPIAA